MARFTWFHKLASPPHCYAIAGRCLPWLAWPALVLIVIGMYGGLLRAPADYQQGEAFRIIYIHAPSAWLSLLGYTTMAVAAAVGLIWRMKLAHALAAATAPVGASFALLCLITGSLWGRPMWGAYWAWDARLTTELILLFLYLGYMALRASFDDVGRADRASAVLALVGVINIPIIHFSVYWWNSLHQGSTVLRAGGPAMPASMLWPLLVSFAGFTCLFATIVAIRLRGEILMRERQASWWSSMDSRGAMADE